MIILTADRLVIRPGIGETIDDGAVCVDAGRIVWTGRVADLPHQTDAEVVRLGRKTLFPGLMDAHVHLAFDGSSDPVSTLLGHDEAALLELMRRSAADLVESGVTTARDLGAPGVTSLTVRDEIAAGRLSGPRLMVAGEPLTSVNGHCWFMSQQVSTSDDVARAVDESVELGVDVIKLMVTGGRMTPGTDPLKVEMAPDIVHASVLRAHDAGLTVAAHCLSAVGVDAAVGAGVDTIEHGTFIDASGGDGFSESLARKFVTNRVALSPTAGVERSHPTPLSLRGKWIRKTHELGVQILAGTDSGIPGRQHAGGFLAGLECLLAAGMSMNSVLASATEEGMVAMGAQGVGALRVGYAADILALDSDPYSDLHAFSKIPFVMAAGHIVRHDQFA
jgi:imidazolonepropionase-like amidohydrolase